MEEPVRWYDGGNASVYGFVERAEPIDDGAAYVVFDGFNADDASPFLTSPFAELDRLRHLRLCVLTFTVARADLPTYFDRNRDIVEDRWFHLELGRQGLRGEFFASLAGPPIPTALVSARPVPHAVGAALRTLFTLRRFPRATAARVASVLGAASSATTIGVYDVGQGSCSALCAANGQPLLYHDFGGGCLRNAFTYPSPAPAFCFCQDPPIVLSHWDFDHLYSATIFARAQMADWIVPAQRVGANAYAFASKLAASGRLHVWPSRLANIAGGGHSLWKATGKSRNDSGLVLVGHASAGDVLLPGDAAYTHVPAVAMSGVDALVAAHHGSSYRIGAPPGAPAAGGPIAYSFGTSNSFHHPTGAARAAGLAAGWAPDKDTPSGHITLLGPTAPPVLLPCSASCDLHLVQ